MIQLPSYLPCSREPDFSNLEDILEGKVPSRPTLFEFFLHDELYEALATDLPQVEEPLRTYLRNIYAYKNAGYDFGMIQLQDFAFKTGEIEQLTSISINEGGVIEDRESFDAYPWPDMAKVNFDIFDEVEPYLPSGMKWIPFGPFGLEENVIRLVGYEDLCYLMVDDPELVQELFDAVGSRLLTYYTIVASHETVGACMVNDDWGFKTGTLLSLEQMRSYVFPWHKRIVDAIHDAGKYALLHSCGQFSDIMEDLCRLGYDARHSYEDAIIPVEDAYEKYRNNFSILGGMDLDFVCRSKPEEIYDRSKSLLERGMEKGGYALGSGNSIADYVPCENYFAMIKPVFE